MARAVRQLLPASFYKRDARVVARELVGCVLVHGPVALRITEVEAYPAGDTASHCRAGKTARNAPMWGPPGRAYMYLCYGIHQMLNIVTDVEGVGSAVLVRAAEIVAGEAEVVARRGWTKAVGPALLAGPGRVAQALALDASFNHHALFERGGLELHVGDKVYLVRERMQVLEERLDPARFLRIHRSAIVRLDLVESLLRGSGGDYAVQLKGGPRLKVSRSRYEELAQILGITP